MSNPDDFKIKAEWCQPPDRFDISILTLDFSGRITREIDRGLSSSTADPMNAHVDMIADVARTVHAATAFHVIKVMRGGLPMMIGGGDMIPSPTWLLEKRVADLRKETEELREKLAEAIVQRDELRRIFAPSPLAQIKATGPDLSDAELRRIFDKAPAIDEGPGF